MTIRDPQVANRIPNIADGSITTAKLETTAQPGLVLVKKQTIGTAVSSVTVTSAFSSSYDNYKIIVSGGSASTNAGYLSIQLGSTTSNYRFDYISANLANATPTSIGSVGTSNFPYVGFKSTTLHANIDVIGPFLTAPTMVSAFAGQTGNNMGTLVGVQIDSTSFTSFIISATTGTITGGTIYVYGYKK